MPRTRFAELLTALDLPFRTKKKRKRAEDIRTSIISVIDELGLGGHRRKVQLYGVTFDRSKGRNFDYWAFDEILVQIDAGSGGGGIRKPLHQVRIVAWRHSSADLITAIRRSCAGNPSLAFNRLLVFKIGPGLSSGYRLTTTIYRS